MHIVTVSLNTPPQSIESVLVESTLYKQLDDNKVRVQMLTANNAPYAIQETAFIIRHYAHHFNENSFHIILSNFYENYQQYYLIAKRHHQYYFAPNNGILSLIAPLEEYEWICKQYTAESNFYQIINVIGKNIAQLLEQQEKLPSWKETLYENLKSYIPLKTTISSSAIQGHILRIDSYGNAITNIAKETFQLLTKGKAFTIILGLHVEPINKTHLHYNSVPIGEVVAFFNDMNLLEIAINQGNASELLGLIGIYQKGTDIKSYQSTIRINIK